MADKKPKTPQFEAGDMVHIIPEVVPGTGVKTRRHFGRKRIGQVMSREGKNVYLVGSLDRQDYWHFGIEHLEKIEKGVVNEETR